MKAFLCLDLGQGGENQPVRLSIECNVEGDIISFSRRDFRRLLTDLETNIEKTTGMGSDVNIDL